MTFPAPFGGGRHRLDGLLERLLELDNVMTEVRRPQGGVVRLDPLAEGTAVEPSLLALPDVKQVIVRELAV